MFLHYTNSNRRTRTTTAIQRYELVFASGLNIITTIDTIGVLFPRLLRFVIQYQAIH